MSVIAAAIAATIAAPPGKQPEVVTPPPIIMAPSPTPHPVAAPPPPPRVNLPPAAPRTGRPLPTPSAAARELAFKLLERIAFFDQGARSEILGQLRWSGSDRCDLANAECMRVAEEIAAREAPGRARETREAISRVLGAHFDRTMTPEQIVESSRFFSGEIGQSLIGSFVSINEESMRGFDPAIFNASSRRGELAAEFARRTEHLPRAPMTAIPSPPAAVRPPAPPAPPPPRPAPKS